jgi:hypothetical protein
MRNSCPHDAAIVLEELSSIQNKLTTIQDQLDEVSSNLATTCDLTLHEFEEALHTPSSTGKMSQGDQAAFRDSVMDFYNIKEDDQQKVCVLATILFALPACASCSYV